MTFLTRDPNENLDTVLYNKSFLSIAPAGFPIVAGGRPIRQGDVLAFLGTGGNRKVAVCKRTVLTAAVTTSSTTMTVRDAHPFQVGDVLRTEGGADGTNELTVTGVNYGSNVITFTGTPVAESSGDEVFMDNSTLNNAIGIALLPSTDMENEAVFGDIALTGMFIKEKLKNFGTGTNDIPWNDWKADGNAQEITGFGTNLIGIYVPSKHF